MQIARRGTKWNLNDQFHHHFHEVSKTQLEPPIHANAEDDNLPGEMAASEELINTQHMGSGPQMASARKYATPPLFAPEPEILEGRWRSLYRSAFNRTVQRRGRRR